MYLLWLSTWHSQWMKSEPWVPWCDILSSTTPAVFVVFRSQKTLFSLFPFLQLLVVLGGRAPLCLRWTCCRHCVGESHPRHTMRLFFLFFLTKFLSLPLFAVAWNPRLRSCRVSLRAKSFKAAACDLGGFSLITPAHNTRAHAPGGARDKVIRCFDPQV